MATLPNQLDLIVDVDGGKLVKNFTSRKSAAPPTFTFGDTVPVTVRLVRQSTGSDPDLPWTELSLTNLSVDLSIGNPAANPTAGQWCITFDSNTTANLSYDASASNVQTALNALTTIQNSGNVTVVKPATGLYRITWDSAGVRNVVTTDVAALYPSSSTTVTQYKTGASTREVQILAIETDDAVNTTFTTALDSAAATITTTRQGVTNTTSEVQTVDLSNPEPYAGTWTLTTNIAAASTTSPLAYNISASSLQAAIIATDSTNLTSKVTVTGTFPEWTVEFNSSLGNVAAMAADVSSLKVPTGFKGNLALTGGGIREYLGGDASKAATLEVCINNTASGTDWTPLQTSCTLRDDLLS